ncbi:hypothetical protein CPB83DRAFT_860829 [Crepidotus variabilis]|uniref:Uncharacterized protein n=1 Tax=Crepidotus variabilis TaxID=179855 RepID=A0A9P6E8Z5_9AGAR|nr:hypothetical protein CPB83DRAFT_860829 [Crepidotus variabilis]
MESRLLSSDLLIKIGGVSVIETSIDLQSDEWLHPTLMQSQSIFLSLKESLGTPTDRELISIRECSKECQEAIVALKQMEDEIEMEIIKQCQRLASMQHARKVKAEQVDLCESMLSPSELYPQSYWRQFSFDASLMVRTTRPRKLLLFSSGGSVHLGGGSCHRRHLCGETSFLLRTTMPTRLPTWLSSKALCRSGYPISENIHSNFIFTFLVSLLC